MKGVQLPEEYIVHRARQGASRWETVQTLVWCAPLHVQRSSHAVSNGQSPQHQLGHFPGLQLLVIQPVLALFPESSSFLERSHQIIQLDEECIEGPVPYFFSTAKTKGVDQINDKHRQYQSTITFELTCVKKLWEDQVIRV
jgi:hypothetical protein